MHRIDDFWLDGENAFLHGIHMQREIYFEEAVPNIEKIKVPGGGDVTYWDGSYKNIRGVAECFALDEDVLFAITNINAWILQKTGLYRRLDTQNEPDFFRLAMVTHGARLEPRLNKLAPFTLEFDCKPKKFYKDGENAREFAEGGSLFNPSPFTAAPLIYVIGEESSGNVTINGEEFTLTNCKNVTIDSEARRVMKGAERANDLLKGDFPMLQAGENSIHFSGGVTGVRIIPRWWTR